MANPPRRTNARPLPPLLVLMVCLGWGNALALLAASPGPLTSADVERYLSPRQRLQAAEEMEEHFPASSESSEKGEESDHQEETEYYLRFTPHHQLSRLRTRALVAWLAFLVLAGIRFWVSRRSDQRRQGQR